MNNVQTNVVEVPLSQMEYYEYEAFLLSHLAYPSLSENIQRDKIMSVLCNLFFRKMSECDIGFAHASHLIRPIYLSISCKETNKVFRNFKAKLNDRFTAAAMVLPFIIAAATSEKDAENFIRSRSLTEKNFNYRSLSIDAMADYVSVFTREKTISNIKSRIWTPSLPVVCLALAFPQTDHINSTSNILSSEGRGCYNDLDHAINILNTTALYEDWVRSIPKLRTASERLLRFQAT